MGTSKDVLTTAKELAKRLLAEHEPTPLDRDIRAQIQPILEGAKKHVASERH